MNRSIPTWPSRLAALAALAALTACMDSESPSEMALATGAATGTAPAIVSQTHVVRPKVGDTYSFMVSAVGTAPFAYQWQSKTWTNNGPSYSNVPGATGVTLTKVAHTSDTDFTYRCKVSNAFGSATGDDTWAEPQALIYQAEAAALSGGTIVSFNPLNPLANRYVKFQHQSGDAITWTLSPGNAGTYDIDIVYANGAAPTAMKIEVNGVVVVSSLAFPSTGSWNTWRGVGFKAALKGGANSLKATILNWGGPHLDVLYVL